MKSINFSDLIYVKDNCLSEDFCNHLIKKFESDHRKKEGIIINGEIDKKYKDTTDLMISSLDDWKDEDNVIFNSSKELLQEYNNYCRKIFPELFFYSSNWNYCDNGYQIQRYTSNQKYDWHHDYNIETNFGGRMVTTIWYLNTLKNSGFTEFLDGTKVYPKIGRSVMFPATWNYLHKGHPPKKETKYIIVSVLYGKPNNI